MFRAAPDGFQFAANLTVAAGRPFYDQLLAPETSRRSQGVRNLLGGCLERLPTRPPPYETLGSTMSSSGASEQVAHFVALPGRRSPPDSAQRIPGNKVRLDLFFAHEGLAGASAHRRANLPSVPREGSAKP